MTAPTPDAVAQARDMAKQASLGHKLFCVGFHDHGELGVEEEWVSWDDAFASLIAAVRAECAAKVDAEPCDWLQDSDGLWRTDCGNLFEFNAGGPFENDMKFCGYCGKKLVEVPYEPMPDDDEEAKP